jgi:hypothetical protein
MTIWETKFAPCAAEDGNDVVFQRSIVPSGASEDPTYQSQYRIDDRVVTWEAYKNKLGTFGILVKARNFLVFQACMLGCSNLALDATIRGLCRPWRRREMSSM